MNHLLILLAIIACSINTQAQNYERDKICGKDTINIDRIEYRYGDREVFKAFNCYQVTPFGVRFDLAYSCYRYNSSTEAVFGRHNGLTAAFGLLFSDFTLSVQTKLGSTIPQKELAFGSQVLTSAAIFNPIRVEYQLGYSINTKYNFAIEPYVAYTRSSFRVINEDSLNQQFTFPKIKSPTLGLGINKYFTIREFEFAAVFVKYGYSFTNYRQLHPSLDRGYTDITFGFSYKGFARHYFEDKIQ
ncbi:MAG: hypothetical protein RL660_2778 [Bacteroidota bacterium]|jgi:hypothetical protein